MAPFASVDVSVSVEWVAGAAGSCETDVAVAAGIFGGGEISMLAAETFVESLRSEDTRRHNDNILLLLLGASPILRIVG